MSEFVTHPFSPEKPVFELVKHTVREHDETDVYGIDHELSYSSGAEDIYSLTLGIVEFRIGGKLHNHDIEGTRVRFNAFIHFPSIRAAQLEGVIVSEVEPEYDELELLGSGLMAVLANKKIRL